MLKKFFKEIFSDEPMFESEEEMKEHFRFLKIALPIFFVVVLLICSEIKIQVNKYKEYKEAEAQYEEQIEQFHQSVQELKVNVNNMEALTEQLADYYGVEQ